MQVDDDTVDPILQINLRQDEREQLERLLEEPMEQIIDPPTTNHDPRDGSCSLAPGLALPPLGPDDIEVTVETSVGPGIPAEDRKDRKRGTAAQNAGCSDRMPGMQKGGTHREFVSPHQLPAIQVGGVDGEGQRPFVDLP